MIRLSKSIDEDNDSGNPFADNGNGNPFTGNGNDNNTGNPFEDNDREFGNPFDDEGNDETGSQADAHQGSGRLA